MLRDPVLKPRFQFDFVLKCTKHSDDGHFKNGKKRDSKRRNQLRSLVLSVFVLLLLILVSNVIHN